MMKNIFTCNFVLFSEVKSYQNLPQYKLSMMKNIFTCNFVLFSEVKFAILSHFLNSKKIYLHLILSFLPSVTMAIKCFW